MESHPIRMFLSDFMRSLMLRSLPGYVPPRKPYGFEAMLNDILAFAATTLITDGRLSMWMPTANDENVELVIPMHLNLEVVSVCVQDFGRCWCPPRKSRISQANLRVQGLAD